MNPVLSVFAAIWIGYFGLLALLPIKYGSIELSSALLVQLIYIISACACALILGAAERPGSSIRRSSAPRAFNPLAERELSHVIVSGLVLSCIGVALLVYVRLAVQGIDYSRGLAVARQLWRTEGEEREGISSPLSIPGYAFGFFFYASTFLGHLHWEHLTRRLRRTLIIASLGFVAIHSVLTGGRTVLLLLIVSVIAAATIRKVQGEQSFPGKFWRNALLGMGGVFGSLTYVLYVFSARATANGISPEAYARTTLGALGAVPTESFLAVSSFPEPLAAATNLGVIAGAYITHSVGTVASVMEYSSRHGSATFIGASALLTRLGILQPADESWALSGAFISLPGAFWYDYGMPGVILAGVVSGASLYAVYRLASRGVGGGIEVGFSAAVLTTGILSPLVLAPDSLAFPFMVLGYVGLAIYSYLKYGTRNWWIVGARCSLVRTQFPRQTDPPAK